MTTPPRRGLVARLAGDGVKFFRDLVVLAGGQTISKLLGFVAFAWLARALDPVDYGAVEYVVGLSVFFAILVDGGLGVIGTRRVARDAAELPLLAHQIPAARLLIAVVGVPVMALLAIATMHDGVPVALVWLFAASLLTAPWRQQWLFQATGRMTAAANAEIIRMGVFVAVVWIWVKSPADILRVGWAEIAGVTAMTGYCIWVQQRRITPVRITGSLAGFGALIREGAAVGSTNFVWALNQFAPLFLVAALLGGVETAVFAGASRIVGSIVQFSNLYHFNLYPAVSRAYAKADGSLARLLDRSLRVTAWGGVLIALILTLFAPALIRLTLGAKLTGAAPLLQIMAWMIPVTLWSGHARWGLAAAGAQARVLWSQLTGLAVTVVACAALGEVLGVAGYAVGSLTGFVAVWVTSHLFAARRGCTPPPFGLVLTPLLLAAAVVAATWRFGLDAWAAGLAMLAFVALAPLIDRRLIGDFVQLGAATRH